MLYLVRIGYLTDLRTEVEGRLTLFNKLISWCFHRALGSSFFLLIVYRISESDRHSIRSIALFSTMKLNH